MEQLTFGYCKLSGSGLRKSRYLIDARRPTTKESILPAIKYFNIRKSVIILEIWEFVSNYCKSDENAVEIRSKTDGRVHMLFLLSCSDGNDVLGNILSG